MVCAHYTVTNEDYQDDSDPTQEKKIASCEREIRQAQAMGIDGFALKPSSRVQRSDRHATTLAGGYRWTRRLGGDHHLNDFIEGSYISPIDDPASSSSAVAKRPVAQTPTCA